MSEINVLEFILKKEMKNMKYYPLLKKKKIFFHYSELNS